MSTSMPQSRVGNLSRSCIGQRRLAVKPQIEHLEDRCLLSVSIGVDSGTDTLNIISDEAADSIRLSLVPGDSSSLLIEVNGIAETPIARDQFGAIAVEGNGGDDSVTIDQTNGSFVSQEAIRVDGGDGTDGLVAIGATGMTLSSSTLTFGGGSVTHTSIETATLLGHGMLSNILNASGFTGSASLHGGAGNDTLMGGTGNDFFYGGAGKDTMVGGAGIDELVAIADANMTLSNTSLNIAGLTSTLIGIERATLTGGSGNNVLNASVFTGSVSLHGGGGDDTLTGGSGNDVLDGGEGNDILTGGPGEDTLAGGGGSDSLFGGIGNDHLVATWEAAVLDGGVGADDATLAATSADDSIHVLSASVNINGNAFSTSYAALESLTVDAGDGVDQGSIDSGVTTPVVLLHLEPAVAAGDDATVMVGSAFSGSGSFADPGDPGSAWTATVDYGDGSGLLPLALNADNTFSLSHLYTQAGTFTVTVQVTDSQGNIGQDTLVVTAVTTYEIAVQSNITRPVKAGSTLAIELQILDGSGNNASSPDTAVTVLGIGTTADQDPDSLLPALSPGHSNPEGIFNYDPEMPGGGGYEFGLKTSNLSSGSYYLYFAVAGDPVIHVLQFTIR